MTTRTKAIIAMLAMTYGTCAMLFGAELAAPDAGFPSLPDGEEEIATNIPPTITVAWNANSETNLVGYIVYWGTRSHSYSERLFTTGTVARLVVLPGTNFIAVTATNTAGLESPFSNEIWANIETGEYSQITNIVTVHAQAATSAAGPWVDVGSIVVTNNATRQLYRLRIEK